MLFLDIRTTASDTALCFVENTMVSIHGGTIHNSLASRGQVLKESVVLGKVMLVTLGGLLKANWWR